MRTGSRGAAWRWTCRCGARRWTRSTSSRIATVSRGSTCASARGRTCGRSRRRSAATAARCGGSRSGRSTSTRPIRSGCSSRARRSTVSRRRHRPRAEGRTAPDGSRMTADVEKLVAAGELAEAARVLGHPFEVEGVVVEGDRRGKVLGFPTANLDVAAGAGAAAEGDLRRCCARPPRGDLDRREPALRRHDRASRGVPARLRRRPVRPAARASSSGSGCATSVRSRARPS